MIPLFTVGACLFLVFVLLWIERLMMNRIRSAIPIRLAVTGTRGKTSVTRLIAAGLREAGLRVLAKTTGSEARVILPDGAEQPVRRRGVITPLEQRRILRYAAQSGCDAVVIEAMSIRPESLRVELGRIICPQTVIVTNTYEDHVAETDDPASVFSSSVPPGATALLPEDFPSHGTEKLSQRNVPYRVIAAGAADALVDHLPHPEWSQNLALSLAACEQLGIPDGEALRGMKHVRMDAGVLGAWHVRDMESAALWTAVNAFATNDPRSAMAALDRSRQRWPLTEGVVVGLLNLRGDRADRTAQWVDALDEPGDVFERLVVCGSVPVMAERRLRRRLGDRVAVVRSRNPEQIMAAAARLSPVGGTLFGFGNIGGIGARLIAYWHDKGESA